MELRRRTFYFDSDGNLLDPRKARCVKDGEYRPANQKAGEAASEAVAVNPDPRLRKEAERRGWSICDWGTASQVT